MKNIKFIQPVTEKMFNYIVEVAKTKYKSTEAYKGDHPLDWTVFHENGVFILQEEEYTLVHFTEAIQLATYYDVSIAQTFKQTEEIEFNNDLLRRRRASQRARKINMTQGMTNEAHNLLNNSAFLTQELNFVCSEEGVTRKRYVDPDMKNKNITHHFTTVIAVEGAIEYELPLEMNEVELTNYIKRQVDIFIMDKFKEATIHSLITEIQLKSKDIIEKEIENNEEEDW